MTAFVQARHYTKGRSKALRVVVWHDMEAPEKSTTAEAVAHYFATTDREASAHLCVDQDSVVECVKPEDTAWAAPGANADGYQIELAGYARQTAAEWRDDASKATIRNAATAVAPVMKAHGIPAKWLTDAELADGKTKGMTTHAQVSRVLKKSTHTDPGPNFPADFCLAEVQHALGTPIAPAKKAPAKKAPAKKAPAKPAPKPSSKHPLLKKGDHGPAVEDLQEALRKHHVAVKVDGDFGPATEEAVQDFQRAHGLDDDGVVGSKTWEALDKDPVRPTVRRGMGSKQDPDENVRHAQVRLTAHGIRTFADGVFGALTEGNVKHLQRKAWPNTPRLWDGIVGPATWRVLEGPRLP